MQPNGGGGGLRAGGIGISVQQGRDFNKGTLV